MDSYVDYVKALLAQGRDDDSIRGDLLAKGLNYQTISWLIQEGKKQVKQGTSLPGSVVTPDFPTTPTPPPLPPKLSGISSVIQTVAQQSPITFSGSLDNDQVGKSSVWKGWLIVFLLCLLPTLLIMFDVAWSVRFGTNLRTLLTLGDIAGMLGLILYALDMVLATRLSWLEDLFGGLNKVYIAHAIIGGSALVFILIHPVLIAIRYYLLGNNTVFAIFIPTTKYLATAYGIFAALFILILMVVTLYIKLPYKIWLTTHKYLGLVFILIGLHVLYEPNVITNNIVLRWYVIVLLVLGLSAFVYRTLLPNILIRRYLYLVKDVQKKATGVIEVTLTPTNRVMHFKAGQFVFVSFHEGGLATEWHPFTIVSAPKDDSFTIAVKSLGDFTETMTRIIPSMVGMSVSIEGAYGRFSFRNFKNANQVWVAGGIGITPFLSMAQALGSKPYNIDLYYSVKAESELIDVDTLAKAQSNNPGQVFRVFPFVTDKYKEHLTAERIATTSGDLKGRDFLICGPQGMMDSLRSQLIKQGVRPYKIHTEEFTITS